MDYKEEYHKALERAKKGLPIDEVFPELKESEDESIRKEMMEYFKDKKEKLHYLCFECGDVKYAPFSEAKQIDDFIAYLEKKKEQRIGWSEEDEAKVNAMCEEGYLKPSEREWLKNLKNRFPAEWSEEDKMNLNGCICSLRQYGYLTYAYFLKRLPERFNLQPKQEWSDDEKTRKEIVDFIYWAIDSGSITKEQREMSGSWLAYLERLKEKNSIDIKKEE